MAHQSFFKHDMDTRVDVAAEKKAAAEQHWRAVCKLVDARDVRQCRCCNRRSDPDATGLLMRGHRHHLIYKSAGGPNETWNICTLCSRCHEDEHHNKLRITGPTDLVDANGPLTFWRKPDSGLWYVVLEEIAVRQVRRD